MDFEPQYYAVIPAPVRYNKKLSAQAKLLYGEITALMDENGRWSADADYFAEVLDTDEQTIRTCVYELGNAGLLPSTSL